MTQQVTGQGPEPGADPWMGAGWAGPPEPSDPPGTGRWMLLTALGAVAAVVIGVLLAVWFGSDGKTPGAPGSTAAEGVGMTATSSATSVAGTTGTVPPGSTAPNAAGPSAVPSAQQTGATTQANTAPAQPSAVTSSVPAVSNADLPDQVGGVLQTYLDAITSGDYATAYAQTSSAFQSTETYAKFQSDLQSTQDSGLAIHSVQAGANGRVTAWVTFTSHQDANKGPGGNQACTNWSIDYRFVPGGENGLLIDSSRGHGQISSAC